MNYSIDAHSIIVPEVVVQRLPHYLNILSILQVEKTKIVSSEQLGYLAQITPAQIRKDLSYFGRFGKQGRGYSVRDLLDRLRQILGINSPWNVAVVGVGRLGRAILSYPGFNPDGFHLVAAFDLSNSVVGETIGGLVVRKMEELDQVVAREKISIAIVAVPVEYTQNVVDQLVACGVKAVLNYAPMAPQVREGIRIRNIDPVLSLQSMTYYIN